MKKAILFIFCVVLSLGTQARVDAGRILPQDVKTGMAHGECVVSMQLVLDSLNLGRNQQIFVTPLISSQSKQKSVALPSVVVSGRSMHYVYLRNGQTKATGKARYQIAEELWHRKNTSETVSYRQSLPFEDWMMSGDVRVTLALDTCGCGVFSGSDFLALQSLNLNPADQMLCLPYPRPVAEIPTIVNHHGKARVEFEVDKFQLHEQVYSYVHKVTKRRHTIDNRQELKTICDSIEYATQNPNVELASITVCGYASPESPYDHNDYLATNRSRALADYIAKKYHLPQDRCTYSAVPENWEGFRQQVVAARDITEQQRKDLLALIDRPTYGPHDYDKKEDELINGPKFAELYSSKIHPDWFPQLRYTDFTIRTQLKPLTTEQLREILRTNPEMMSLNQFYTVALAAEHGGEEFHAAMAAALKYFPEDPTANLNAAAVAIEDKNYDLADHYIQKAGESDDANIIRGILATHRGDFDSARTFFMKAASAPEAIRNLKMLQ